MNDVQEAFLRDQRAFNASTANRWQDYGSHRERIMGLSATVGRSERLTVLGAGNCNDLDLQRALAQFNKITLVDLDELNLRRGVERQLSTPPPELVLRAPMNIAGLLGSSTPVQTAQRQSPSLLALADECAERIGEPADCVLSTCVLSQIVLGVARGLGPDNPHCLECIQFERALHLHLLISLLEPGGHGFLVSDLVSTDTAPQLLETPADRLPSLMLSLLQARNFFTGMNPLLLAQWLKTDPVASQRVTSVNLLEPWVWKLSPERAYLVFVLHFVR
jgi:hypothetical protein